MSKLKLKRLSYYLSSFFEILKQENAFNILQTFFFVLIGAFLNWPLVLRLKKFGLSYKISSWLDLLTLKEVVLDEDYESLVSIEKNDKVVVDIGAGFGDFAILTAKKYPQTKIFAIEPDPFYSDLLNENLKMNGVKNVIPVKKSIFKLEDIFELNPQINQVDFLKIDCEGCEFSIFENAERESFMRIRKVVLEYHLNQNHWLSDLERIFKENGFKVKISQRENVPGIGLLGAEK